MNVTKTLPALALSARFFHGNAQAQEIEILNDETRNSRPAAMQTN